MKTEGDIMEFEEKRRLKNGGYNKQQLVELFLKDLRDIKEFVIICEYKSGQIGGYNSTSDGLRQIGMIETAKVMVMDNQLEE
jgi:hypothetical protein